MMKILYLLVVQIFTAHQMVLQHQPIVNGLVDIHWLIIYSMYANHHPDQHGLVFSPSNPKKSISSHDGGLSLTTG